MGMPNSKMKLIGQGIDFLITDDLGRRSGKFAPVAPYHIYQQFAVNGYIPNTVLLLAHDVVANKKEYKETFEHPAWTDTTIIMDNSLVELKEAVDVQMVFEACEAVAADIAVLPDVMGEGLSTFNSTSKAYNEWKWKLRDYKLMPLIHGKDIQEWLLCAEYLAKYCATPWIGIPRKAEGIKNPNTGKVYSRFDLVNFASWTHKHCNIHLFGFSDSIWEDMRAASHPKVNSIDSAVPLRLETLEILSEVAGPRGDWWEKAKFTPEMIERCKKVDQYIHRANTMI